MIQPVPVYEDNKTYPILVRFPGSGYNHIIEMLGSEVNRWNNKVFEENQKLSYNEQHWRI